MKISKIVSFVTLAAFIFTGCGSTIGNLDVYKAKKLEKSKYMPSKDELSGKRLPRVIIVPLNDKGIKTAVRARLGNSMAVNLETLLNEGRAVKIVKRVEKFNWSKELKKADIQEQVGSDIGAVDYVITGDISNANFKHKFFERKISINPKTRRVTGITPAHINYIADVAGSVKILKFPSMDVMATIPFRITKQEMKRQEVHIVP